MAIPQSAVVNACGRWHITNGGIYGNRLQNIYLDYKWNCVAFADAGLCSICGYNFGLLELDNFAIDLRGITFLQLETQDKKRYPFSWILSDFNNSNNASCVPHEMLHNCGCEHTPADQLNIMYPIAGTNTVIRQPQWIKVR